MTRVSIVAGTKLDDIRESPEWKYAAFVWYLISFYGMSFRWFLRLDDNDTGWSLTAITDCRRNIVSDVTPL